MMGEQFWFAAAVGGWTAFVLIVIAGWVERHYRKKMIRMLIDDAIEAREAMSPANIDKAITAAMDEFIQRNG